MFLIFELFLYKSNSFHFQWEEWKFQEILCLPSLTNWELCCIFALELEQLVYVVCVCGVGHVKFYIVDGWWDVVCGCHPWMCRVRRYTQVCECVCVYVGGRTDVWLMFLLSSHWTTALSSFNFLRYFLIFARNVVVVVFVLAIGFLH